jgi:hypothetical protein
MLAKYFYTFLCDMHFEATQVVAGMWVHTATHSNDISERWGGSWGGGGWK